MVPNPVVIFVPHCHELELYYQWLFLVPLKGGRWHIIPQFSVYTTYIPLVVLAFWWLYATYHLLGEPETTIEKSMDLDDR